MPSSRAASAAPSALVRGLVLALLTGLAAPAEAQVAASGLSCGTNATGVPVAANGRIAWPADAPVWTFSFYRPANRTTGMGSGLELRNVYYLGRKVLERAGVPVLNVDYDAGAGCGCYRDWQHTESRFTADGVQAGGCFADATPGLVQTTCDRGSPGPDAGTFTGVAAEDYGDRLVLTTHMAAGWYRYRMRWTFHRDGRIQPEYAFSAERNVCTASARQHHAYWRFDFDLDGTPTTDVVTETDASGATLTLTHEASRTWRRPEDGVRWAVTDRLSGIGVTITPGAEDLTVPVDAFSKTDVLVLRYRVDELEDGVAATTGCTFQFDGRGDGGGAVREAWLNGEALEGEDVVVWYRSSTSRRAGEGSPCRFSGPTLQAFGFGGVGAEAEPPGEGAVLEAVYPNPLGETATVRFRLETAQPARVLLLDARGRTIRTLFEGPAPAGAYVAVSLEAGGLAAGTYLVRLEGAGGLVRTAQVTVAR